MTKTKQLKNNNKLAEGGKVSYAKDKDFAIKYNPDNEYTYGMGPEKLYDFGKLKDSKLLNTDENWIVKPSSLSDTNPYAGKLLATPSDTNNYGSLSDKSREYIQAKLGYNLGEQEKLYGPNSALWNVNHILMSKGSSPVSDWSEVDSALVPLIKKRDKKGLGGILGTVAPIALGLLAGPVGGALGTALGVGTTAGTALAGAGLGALGSGITGGNVLKGALFGGGLS